ncbi:hypothetical protein CABS01_10555 [Colletotrichum abscissum]|uniref:Uncharacterized protein n=1 Tax=Colletotrichum abscissum TaxID=1671311 RepID=A0A9P9XEL3_9PEZI|nr:uncharacterized protein CABS01_10555 [Colletotrichum abscissum]KAI3550106.1 hypothetical protein CABS02_07794 [Colletotrichum abscissum]KAK1498780.1 hypothetical protein CABS01_10555 [Colletotrichum abscissum]
MTNLTRLIGDLPAETQFGRRSEAAISCTLRLGLKSVRKCGALHHQLPMIVQTHRPVLIFPAHLCNLVAQAEDHMSEGAVLTVTNIEQNDEIEHRPS